jgi:hypothetical protein
MVDSSLTTTGADIMLEHKNGGRIAAVYAIGHETYKRVATWHYVCRVEWSDGTVSERLRVAPYAICFDRNQEDAALFYDRLSEQLNDYLATEGTWLVKPKHMRDGRLVHWVPKVPDYEVAV